MNAKDFLRDPRAILLISLFFLNLAVYIAYTNYEGWADAATVTYCLVPAIATAAIFTVYLFYGKESIEGKTWLLITLGMGLWALGEVMWVAYDLAGQDPFPSFADAAFIIAYLPIIYAVVSKARYTKVKRDRKKDLAIAGIVALIAVPTAVYVFNPILSDTYYDSTIKAVSLLYPTLDIVLLAYALFIAIYWGPTVSRGWYILAAAMMFMTLADIAYAALEWKEIWITYLDLLWTTSYVLFALGALYQKKHHESFM